MAKLLQQHVKTIKGQIANLVSRMTKNNFIEPFVIYTLNYRLIWVPRDVYVGYFDDEDNICPMQAEENSLFVIKHDESDTIFRLLKEFKDDSKLQNELEATLFNFFIDKCKMEIMDVRRACITAEKLGKRYYNPDNEENNGDTIENYEFGIVSPGQRPENENS